MITPTYRIESSFPIVTTLPRTAVQSGSLLGSWDLAVSIAAKSLTNPPGGEIRVVHIPSGEVVFSKTSDSGNA